MTDNGNRILVITRDISYPGGTEYFLYEFIQYLSGKIDPSNIYLLEVDGSGKFANNNLEVNLKERGINVLDIPEDIAKLEFWDPVKLSYFDDLISKINPGIVHSFLFNADFVAYYLKAGKEKCVNSINQTKNINKLHTFYSDAFLKLPDVNKFRYRWISSKLSNFSIALEASTKAWMVRKNYIDNELEPIISRNTDVITTVSNEGARKWANWSVKPPIFVPCSAIGKNDLALIDKLISQNQGKTKSEIVQFICVTRLVEGKGVEDVIASFKKTLIQNQDIELIIVGDGTIFDSIKASITGVPQIKVVGFKPREKVFEMLAESDVFVLASHSEGLPLSIQEAMAFNLPVIATKVGGIPDLVSDQKNGLLSNPGDIDELSKSMLELSKSSDIRRRMGIISRRKLEEGFLKEKSYSRLFEQYSYL